MNPPGGVLAAASSHHFEGSDIVLVVVVVVLILVTGFLAASETAITRTPRVRARSFEEEGRRHAATLLRLVEHTERVLPVVLFALEVCTLVAATLVGVVAEHAFGGLGVVLATAFEVVVIFVVAELAPKTWAVQHTDRAALGVAPVIRFLYAFAPLRWVTRGLIGISNILLPGKGIKEGPYTSDEMLRAMADTAADEAVIEGSERTLIHSIIDFGDTVVRDVMVPRPDMVAVESRARIEDVVDIAIAVGYSRIPVYGQGIDDVLGLVFVKDLMRAERDGNEDNPVTSIMREAQFVPESKRVAELLPEMQAGNFHMAMVVDEFGGTAGLVTLEDLLEELVGEIHDEYDTAEIDSERLEDGTVVVNARMPIDEVNELLDDSGLPEGDWDTVGGLIYSQLGHVPTEGEEVNFEGHRLTAEEVSGRRIGKVRISPPVAADQPPADR
ncbi:hemolysin family protein [Acidiferrimicrobium sp. IK]|uniref:hemolysin family protein n=1 Tax=Acidiferrimicrobium sp. IK TaxID=2871700 RepID=UPI0021CB0137|nr:hemolysin family protein [Acidiferrimicrobium sp. IK]MCU4183925.1 hemolysin family protein [Acidiferrimicrobium sp. IK]